ncbi:MAG: hypothetical protein QOJ04_4096 [Caballeronia sp.]|nr:hypothetical protein [Caballeronia sp.]
MVADQHDDTSPVRRIEIVAALSLATDMAIGQPLEFALRSCIFSVRLAEALGFGDAEISDVYHQALLRYIGCNADTYALAGLFGNEMELRREFARVDQARDAEVAQVIFRALRRANAGRPFPALALGIARGLMQAKSTSVAILAGHCEVAERIAERLGFDDAVVRNLGQLYERWDGKGLPKGLKGEAISPAVRVVTLAQDAILLSEVHGTESTFAIIAGRRGGAYDPKMVDVFLPLASSLLVQIEDPPTLDHVLTLEPRPQAMLSAEAFDEACVSIADFIDIRAPMYAGHSRAVATLAEQAALRCGLPVSDAKALRHAGFMHDLGEVAVPMSTWSKTGALSDAQQEAIRLHPYNTERILARFDHLAPLGTIAGCHHERLDGSGYHRGARAAALSPAARILAAAECYQTKREARPHRTALSADAAANHLRREVRAGAIDADAAAAVLDVAGHKHTGLHRQLSADLTSREIEVLRRIAEGRSGKEIARALGISPKTADNHTQSIYSKIRVSTRAAATLFAIEHGLLTPQRWSK